MQKVTSVLIHVLGWLFGLLLILFSIVASFSSLTVGVCSIFAGLLIFPPARKFVKAKLNFYISQKLSAGASFCLIVLSLVFIVQSQSQKDKYISDLKQKKEIQLQETQKRERASQFIVEKKRIATNLKALLSTNKFKEAIEQFYQYKSYNDPEINSLLAIAGKNNMIRKNATETQKIIAELQKLPERSTFIRRDRFKRLVQLNPANSVYQARLSLYVGRIQAIEREQARLEAIRVRQAKAVEREQLRLEQIRVRKAEAAERKIQAAEEREQQVESEFSAWDGSHRGLTGYLKESMNDPESYEHVKTTYRDMGDYLIIFTTVRGKNAFGAKILQKFVAKVGLDGEVLEVNPVSIN